MIYFIRHGESESNRDKVFSGRLCDVELTEAGRQQAKAAGLQIAELRLDIKRIICSPLQRATDTARIITAEINFPFADVILDERLTEYDLGVTSGTPIREITAQEIITAEGAEAPALFLRRIKEALHEYSKMDGNTLIVSHGGVSRMINCYKEGGDVNEFPNSPKFKNAELVEIFWA